MLLVEVENILLKRKPNLIIVYYSFKMFLSSKYDYPLVDFLQTLFLFLAGCHDITEEMFFLAGTPQTSKSI